MTRTLKAWDVLDDCHECVAPLESLSAEENMRIPWAAACALLRTVGQVLDKVDGKRDAETRRAVDSHWKSLKADEPNPLIFWHFIDRERNAILKTYEFGVDWQPGHILLETGDHLLQESGSRLLTENEGLIANRTPWEGKSALDLVRDAIAWWEIQLLEIESVIGQQ